MAVYNFSKSPVNIDRLTLEINGSSISSAVYQYTNYRTPALDIYFNNDLSGTDQTTLSNIVASHTGAPVYVPAGFVAVADGAGSIEYVQVLDPEVVTTSGITTHFNLEGGTAYTIYGGTTAIDAGNAFTTY